MLQLPRPNYLIISAQVLSLSAVTLIHIAIILAIDIKHIRTYMSTLLLIILCALLYYILNNS